MSVAPGVGNALMPGVDRLASIKESATGPTGDRRQPIDDIEAVVLLGTSLARRRARP